MRRLSEDRQPPQFGGALNPVDIISRAALLVPENRDREADAELPGLTPGLAHDAFAEDEQKSSGPLPAARARRRPLRLVAGRLFDLIWFAFRFAVPAVLIIGLPTWLWTGGHIDDARAFAEREMRLWSGWAANELGLRVTSVRVRGRERTSADQLRAALGIEPGTPMLEVDLEAVRTRIETLPWVERVYIRRELPNRLTIRLVERTPIARIRSDEAIHLVDAGGTVIRATPDDAHADLVMVEGGGAAEHAAPLVAMLESQPEIGRRVVTARRHGNRRWDLQFDTEVLVMLPAGFERAAWRKLLELQHRLRLLDRGYAVLDMRLPDRLVIRPGGSDRRQESQG